MREQIEPFIAEPAKRIVDEEFLDHVESVLGCGSGAWDMVDPMELCQVIATQFYLKLQTKDV